MKIFNSFKDLTKYELIIWLISVVSIVVAFWLSGSGDYLTIIASLIGVTALIFVAKGYVLGQVLTVVFAIFYGIISFYFKYYGEMITYLFMTAPIAILSVISWIKHPYKESSEVEVSHITGRQVAIMVFWAILTTVIMYFVLGYMGNSNLLVSTLSILTSFIASYLTFLRSPYYAIGYAANDVILIILWLLAAIESISYLPMVVCFVMFLINDLYGFYNWLSMRRRQLSQQVSSSQLSESKPCRIKEK